ncbi:hypothetical protein [Calothrix sp. FACHB-1219]|uniref:hypothetical protein n=1 Tax=Calothrix sp. FACHB-1219 TaxID=2692778 RepID=UPI0030D74436
MPKTQFPLTAFYRAGGMYGTNSRFTMDFGCWDISFRNQHLDWSASQSITCTGVVTSADGRRVF